MQDKEFNNLLRQVDPQQLLEFVVQYAHWHPSFKNEIVKRFLTRDRQLKDRKKSIQDYRDDAKECFNTGNGRNQFDRYEASAKVVENLSAMMGKARDFVSRKNFKDAAAVAQSLIEAIPRNYNKVDDFSGEISGLFSDAVYLLEAFLQSEVIDKGHASEVFHWLEKELHKDVYHHHGFYEIDSLLLPASEAAGLIEKALDITEERINRADSYMQEVEVMKKIRLLQRQKMDREVEKTIDQYVHLPAIRKMRTERLIKSASHAEAIQLIKQGIADAGKQNNEALLIDLKEQLLDIYILLDDHENVVRCAEDLFYTGHGVAKYYQILKEQTAPDIWADRLDAILAEHPRKSKNKLPNSVLAQIYIEEKYWYRLLQLMDKMGIWEMEAYEKHLKPLYPSELLALYARKIGLYAEQHESRNHCQYVASILSKMRTYPEGDLLVDRLLAEFRLKYKDREIMMEELRNA